MELYFQVFLAVLAVCSILLNIFLYRKTKRKQQSPGMTEDATALLARLMSNQRTVVVVDVIDPSDIFYYSPKDRK